MMPGVPCLVEAIVQITMDPEAPPYPHMVSMQVGQYKIPEVSVPPLDFPALLLLSGLLEEISEISDLLMDLVHATLLDLMLGLNAPVSSLPLPSVSAKL